MAALIEAASDVAFPAEIVGVISDQPERRASRSPPSAGYRRRPSRAAISPASRRMTRRSTPRSPRFGAEIVALAGYMRLLTPPFVDKWQGRLINIHPALLPSFKGLDTHRRALEAGVRMHGCTVHFVTPEVDAGPIIAQAAVPVLAGDSEQELAARVLKLEHQLYPLALRLVAEGRVRMENGRAVFDLAGASERRALGAGRAGPAPAAPNLEDLARFTP